MMLSPTYLCSGLNEGLRFSWFILGDIVLYGILVNVITRSMGLMDYKRGSVVPANTLKVHWGNSGTDLLNCNLCTRRREVVNCTLQELYPWNERQYPMKRGQGGCYSWSGCLEQKVACSIRIPTLKCPACTCRYTHYAIPVQRIYLLHKTQVIWIVLML